MIKIKKIVKKKYKGVVYDLSVKNKKSYNINGLAVHNSAAGSLVSYLMGITRVDPIRFNLLFSRFINEERVDVPDMITLSA